MFIDKLEEPFNADFFRIPGANNSTQGKYNYSIWAYAQLAFADAVNTLFASRNHIKINYSIRKEALYRGEIIQSRLFLYNHISMEICSTGREK